MFECSPLGHKHMSAVAPPPPLEEALSTKLLLSVQRNVSWIQVLAVIRSLKPQSPSTEIEVSMSLIQKIKDVR